jgi:7,8-dihydropterin-6-yl-methyl-4-(beta-D-ribofuranosyl)aminobenzene 5'-phosphate synthase
LKLTIIYDNTSQQSNLKADWGFSCFIEHKDSKILFDTGTKKQILLDNAQKLKVDLSTADIIFISHSHMDHMGGLNSVLKENDKASIYLPISQKDINIGGRFLKLDKPAKIKEDVIASGLLECEERKGLVEQSLFIESTKGIIVIVGCSHPKVRKILERAKEFGNVYALIGGLHGFKEFELLEHIELVCPTHCTKHIEKIKSLYPNKYVKGGVGAKINI